MPHRTMATVSGIAPLSCWCRASSLLAWAAPSFRAKAEPSERVRNRNMFQVLARRGARLNREIPSRAKTAGLRWPTTQQRHAPVAEEGHHDELLQSKGRYAEMFELQAASYR